jgi:hypothetical protein
MIVKTIPGLLKYTVECKKCDWTFSTDSTAQLAKEGRSHRARHWEQSPAGIAHADWERRISRLRWEQEQRRKILDDRARCYAEMEKAKQKVKSLEENISTMDRFTLTRDEMVLETLRLRNDIQKYTKMFHELDERLSG